MSANDWVRVSPGKYKNKKTGEVKASAQNPGRSAKKAAPPAPKQTGDGNPNTPGDNIPVNQLDITDPTAVANAQFGANKATNLAGNQMNNANQNLMYGSQEVTFDPVTGQPTIAQRRSAPEEQKYQQDVGIETAANDRIQQALGNYQSLFSQPFDVSADRRRVEDSLYSRNKQLLDEQFQQNDEEFEQSLAQRGIPPGSPLEDQMRTQYSRQKADAYAGARNDAISEGRNEQVALSGVDNARRQQGMNEMSGLYGLGMGVRDPQFQGFQGQGLQNTDVAGTAQGYYALGQDNDQFNKKLAVEKEALRRAGRGSGRDPLADYRSKQEIDWEYDQKRAQWAKDNQPKAPGAGGAAANIIGNIGAGFMNGLGNSLGGSFS